jgi:hypothetical protein
VMDVVPSVRDKKHGIESKLVQGRIKKHGNKSPIGRRGNFERYR